MDADPAVSADLVLVALDAPRSHPPPALPCMSRDTGRATAGRAGSFNSGNNCQNEKNCRWMCIQSQTDPGPAAAPPGRASPVPLPLRLMPLPACWRPVQITAVSERFKFPSLIPS